MINGGGGELTGNGVRGAECAVKKRELWRGRVAVGEGESEKDANSGGKEKGEGKA